MNIIEFLCGIPIKIVMKVFEAKEEARTIPS